ncbi:MAG: DUF928 domain-containing protein [Leptolyngbyaceae cyanobacterium MO_188.B28]|nr:DUF928 domain-containing protein [Leptolyngbyaceae cyanobacterium MO_188.B28]
MTNKTLYSQPFKKTWAIAKCALSGLTFTIASFISYPAPLWAQSAGNLNELLSSGQANFTLDFSDTGRPHKRVGGGSRGPCRIADNPPLTALTPYNSAGLTVAESPSFWFYIPYALTPEHSVEFVVKTGDDEVYKTRFSGNETTPGIVNLDLPSTVSLEIDKNYNWYLLVYCDPQNQSRFVYVEGLVRRINRPDIESQLEAATPQERTTLYATEGIWYDTLTTLAETRRTSPNNTQINEDWTNLLRSVGLDSIAAQPFVSCCYPEN